MAMKKLGAFALILMAFAWAFWMSSSSRPLPTPANSSGGDFPEPGIPQPPLPGAGPAAYLEYANQLQTATAAPAVRATHQAQMTAAEMEQRIFTDGLTATAASALTQQSVNLTATPVAQTATAQFAGTATMQAYDHATQTATAGLAATSLAQTQIAPLIQAQAEAERTQSYTRVVLIGLFAVAMTIAFLFVVVQYKEYLDDRQTKRRDESIIKRVVPREGASPLYFNEKGEPIDVEKAFFPNAAQPAPSIEHQERVTQRAQAIQMAREVAKVVAAAPGTHTQNYLANLAAQLNGGNSQTLRQLPPEINVLDRPPAYAEEVENRLLLESEGNGNGGIA
jgi:hypothetical protein